MAKVNVRAGKLGWRKRINRSVKAVTREATLTDDVDIGGARDAIGKIHAAAKGAVLKRKHVVAKDISKDLVTHMIPSSEAPSSSSAPAGEEPAIAVDNADEDMSGAGSSDDDEPMASGFLSNLKAFVAPSAQQSSSRSTPQAQQSAGSARPKAKAVAKAAVTPKAAAKSLCQKVACSYIVLWGPVVALCQVILININVNALALTYICVCYLYTFTLYTVHFNYLTPSPFRYHAFYIYNIVAFVTMQCVT